MDFDDGRDIAVIVENAVIGDIEVIEDVGKRFVFVE